MKVYLDCIPCFLRQALEAARLATDDTIVQEEVMRLVLTKLPGFPLNQSPPEIGWRVHGLVKEVTGNRDPYASLKHTFNQKALALYPKLVNLIENSDEPFETAVRLALAGNMIDFGAQPGMKDINLEEEIEAALKAHLDIETVLKLKTATKQAKKILFLGDNAGEIVFDKLLVKQIGPQKITYVVKGRPIINDATLEDAQTVALTDLVNVIDNGSEVPGTVLSLCSQDFLRHYKSADLIIAKGQGHYETLSDEKMPIAFILKVKCPVIAEDIGHKIGGLVVHLRNVYNAYKS